MELNEHAKTITTKRTHTNIHTHIQNRGNETCNWAALTTTTCWVNKCTTTLKTIPFLARKANKLLGASDSRR